MKGKIASQYGYGHLELQVLKSNVGYYIGTFENGPVSRESQYFATKEEAQDALDKGIWVQHKLG